MPSAELGPAECCALARLARSCLEVGIEEKGPGVGLVPSFTLEGGSKSFGIQIPEIAEKRANIFRQTLLP